jgi:hypothetical protein
MVCHPAESRPAENTFTYDTKTRTVTLPKSTDE